MAEAPVSVIIPTFKRVDALRGTLNKLLQCDPAAAEILVHVDAGDQETPAMLAVEFPMVELICSDTRQGPGGGRNKLMNASGHETVISLDDDSWPICGDFMGVARHLIECHTSTAAIACHIVEQDSQPEPQQQESPEDSLTSTFSFVGCGAIIRRSAFLKTAGYLPLRYAYGMEEADVSLQLLNLGYQIKKSAALSVFHDCPRETHHRNPRINGAQITNTGLLAFLRYPVSQWPYGLMQVINRVRFAIRKRRLRGIISGIASIPATCWRYRRHHSPVKASTIRDLRRLKQEAEN